VPDLRPATQREPARSRRLRARPIRTPRAAANLNGGLTPSTRAAHRVFIADDQRLLLEALKAILGKVADIDVVGVTHEPQRLVERLRELEPDVLVLDHIVNGADRWTLLDRVRRARPGMAVIVFTGSDDPGLASEALARGASGFLHKSASPDEVVQALRAAATGATPIVDPRLPRAAAAFGLTAREEDVYAGLTRGLTLAEIGRELQISRQTVKSHVQNLYMKLNVHNRLEAIRALVDGTLLGPRNGL
jgi:two-component system nitrate/nitrite response regulator NarL